MKKGTTRWPHWAEATRKNSEQLNIVLLHSSRLGPFFFEILRECVWSVWAGLDYGVRIMALVGEREHFFFEANGQWLGYPIPHRSWFLFFLKIVALPLSATRKHVFLVHFFIFTLSLQPNHISLSRGSLTIVAVIPVLPYHKAPSLLEENKYPVHPALCM